MCALRAWSPFIEWALVPPHPGNSFESFNESATRGLIWRELLQLAEVGEVGRALFQGTEARRNRLWAKFGSYIRQAKAYDDAAAQVKGPSSALLQYYAALNLAKAELLTQPDSHAYRHGLRYSSTRARSIAKDFLTVEDGVFPLLYQKRTGATLPIGTRLNVRRLLASVPEMGWELTISKYASSTAARLIHLAVTAANLGWAVIAIDNPAVLLGDRPSRQAFMTAFEQVAPVPSAPPPGFSFANRYPPRPLRGSDREWRDVFAISRRFGYGTQSFFESRWQVPVHPLDGGRYSDADFAAICAQTNASLQSFIDLPVEEGSDATLASSHRKDRMMPMPAGLARYAALFYLSSLVRYQPDQVDLANNPEQYWLMAAFADQSALHILQSMLSGITGKWHLYYSPGAFRS